MVLFDIANHPFELELRYPETVEAVSTNADCSLIACGWGGEFQGGAELRRFPGGDKTVLLGEEAVHDVRVSPAGDHVLTVSKYGGRRLTLWRGRDRLWEYEVDDRISASSFSPDGSRVLLGCWDGRVRVFDVQGHLHATLQHPHFLYDATFGPGGETILTRCRDGRTRLWKASGPLIFALEEGTGDAATFMASGLELLTSHAEGAAIHTLTGDRQALLLLRYPAAFVAASPDRQYVATGQDVGKIVVWKRSDADRSRVGRWFRPSRMQDWKLEVELTAPGWLSELAFSPTGRTLLGVWGPNDLDADIKRRSGPGIAMLWKVTGEPIAELRHAQRITCARFSATGERLVTAAKDKVVRLWRVERRSPLELGHGSAVNALDFLAGDAGVVTGAADGTVKRWDSNANLLSSFDSGGHISSLCIADDEHVLLGGHTGEARLFSLGGELRATFRPEVRSVGVHPVVEVTCSPTGRVLTTSYNTASLWNRAGGLLAQFVHRDGGSLTSVRFSPDGSLLLTAGLDKSGARLWHVDGTLMATYADNDYYVTVAEHWPDGRHVLTVGKSMRLWDFDGHCVATFDVRPKQVLVRSDRLLTVTDVNRVAGLWSLEGRLLAELEHDDHVTCAVMSPDGFRILTAAGRRLHVWDLAGNQLSVMDHDSAVDNVQTSPSGRFVTVISHGHAAKLWQMLSPDRIIESFRDSISGLSDEEMKTYLAATKVG